ncbi:MAG TPA: hypothetical protein VFG15_30355 [Amycolatopsis sp.]|nr:hypothetical protein [Amycolatopsis sp.]
MHAGFELEPHETIEIRKRDDDRVKIVILSPHSDFTSGKIVLTREQLAALRTAPVTDY